MKSRLAGQAFEAYKRVASLTRQMARASDELNSLVMQLNPDEVNEYMTMTAKLDARLSEKDDGK